MTEFGVRLSGLLRTTYLGDLLQEEEVMGRFIRTAVTVCLGCLVVFVGSAAAGGREGAPSRMVAAGTDGVVSAVVADQVCEKARGRTGERGPCGAEMVGGASAGTIATATQLVADGDLLSADGVRLSQVAATTTIYTRTWWQETRGLYYINWWEKHSGRIYYHTGHVWSTTTNHGYTGNHNCDQGGGIGYDVKVTSCFTETRSADLISEWDYWKVYVFFQGFPISASHNMHANAYGSGNIYFYW
jgi:hypothetical protein